MIETPKKILIPQSLRRQQRWYTFGPITHPEYDLSRPRYSPRTLRELRPDHPDDLSGYAEAVAVASDHHWMEGVGIRITPPYVAVALFNCFDYTGWLANWVRPLIAPLGGYWERMRSTPHILGIMKTNAPFEPGAANYKGSVLFLSNDGFFNISGNALPRLAGNPDRTNQDAFEAMVAEIKRGAPSLPEAMKRLSSWHQGTLFH